MKTNILGRVHFVGIGGIGMSALAKHLARLGVEVSGSDCQENYQTNELRKKGIKIFVPHAAQNIKGAKLVVRTSAISLNNEEISYAASLGIPIMLREELLGQIFNSYTTRIAVCGTHGKTTTTAMIHCILNYCGISHAAFIGGEYNGENYFWGENIVVAEACEYNRSFLQLRPTICLCLNVEFDHPDCYRNLADVEQAFNALFAQSERIILPHTYKSLNSDADFYFGNEKFSARDSVVNTDGYPTFTLFDDENKIDTCSMKICGEHNIQNALAALSVAKLLDLPMRQATKALSQFKGVDRRWTKQNCLIPVVCDYAHHPTEIAAAIKTAVQACSGKIFCVFQPHTYSRTKAFLTQFVDCFDGAFTTIILPVFAAREVSSQGTTSFKLYRLARERGKNVKYFASFERAANFLLQNVRSCDLVLLVGAGDINKLAELLK